MKIAKPKLRDYVTLKAKEGSVPLEITGEVRAISYVLDSKDDKVWIQYLIRRNDSSLITVGEPVWELTQVEGWKEKDGNRI